MMASMQTCNRNTFTVRAIRGREEVGRVGEGGGEVFVVEIGQKKEKRDNTFATLSLCIQYIENSYMPFYIYEGE